MKNQCPVCWPTLQLRDIGKNSEDPRARDYDCPRCGPFSLSGTLVSTIKSKLDTPVKRAILSHAIRQMQRDDDWPFITSDTVKNILSDKSLPSPHEQADNLILWLGNNLAGPGETKRVTPETHQSVVGAISPSGLGFVVHYMFDHGLIEGNQANDFGDFNEAVITLTFDGWDRYESIKRGALDSRKAFMAMKFGDTKLDDVYLKCFKPAVEKTGFHLERIDEEPKAGSIDDRLRVEILTARFLLADLTYGNQGAYWEAGFSEGLGKPVIYTCEEKFFHRKEPYKESGGVHFDANHQMIIVWDENDLPKTTERLKATVRATFPEDAKLEDD